jgi:CRP/FNR family transcriptional regulator, nitrogen oxide reductase regulator
MPLDPLNLRQVSVFQHATDDDLKLIASHSIERSIEEGEFFFFQGDPATYFYVLISGRAKLTQTSLAGQQVNLRTISPWQMFGALGAVREDATYPATAQALENSTAMTVKSDYLRELMQTRPYLSVDLMKLMTTYIQEMQERYRELATEKVERRIARALLRLAAQMGSKIDGGIELTFTRQELAEMSGTTLYTVSRVLSEWERQGLVEAGRERVVIRNPHGVVSIAEELNP